MTVTEHTSDRLDYNVAVANGQIVHARAIDRRMKARERRMCSTEWAFCECGLPRGHKGNHECRWCGLQ